ncbi:hypothetical protein A2U01_0082118, partial [Trifolium medium]|nr:hypothetical protein [Trifolium medium]
VGESNKWSNTVVDEKLASP